MQWIVRKLVQHPLVPAKAGTQPLALDSRFRGNERKSCDAPCLRALMPRSRAPSAFMAQMKQLTIPDLGPRNGALAGTSGCCYGNSIILFTLSTPS